MPESRHFYMPWVGGSWVVTSRIVSRLTMVITYIKGLITPLITTHEPPNGLAAITSFPAWHEHYFQETFV